MTITIDLPAEKSEQLTREAEGRGLRVEQLLEQLADDYLARRGAFEAAAGYVLHKNAELYRRLAR